MKFSEMPYERPDKDEIIGNIKRLTKELESAKSFSAADEIFLREDKYFRHINTLQTICAIRHTIDTRDKFYDEEENFWNSASPEISEFLQEWTKALLNSEFRSELEKKYGDIIFLNAEIELKTFSPDIIPLLQQENDLVQEYEKLLASARIPFENGVYNIPQMAPFKNDSDDKRRLSAWKAEGKWYSDNGAKLDEIYDKLVFLRDKAGKALGYKDYTQLGYYRMMRNCYDKNDVEKFRNAVIKYLVPVAQRLCKEQAQRLNVPYPMSFADNALMFREGNPKPAGNADEIMRQAKLFYDGLSNETSEFFADMTEKETMDLLAKEGKTGGGYCESIYDYDIPFIFANFNGTRDDVETVTHEAGHAFAGWYNRKRVPAQTVWPSLEACEVHSMSMEFFSWLNAEGFFGDDSEKFKYAHLASSITFIPYGTMVDHFQHIVYDHPEYTPEMRHSEWKRLLGIYMPWLRLDGEIPFYSEGKGWQRQSHIYCDPFYYIDYCLAQTVALEFWTMIQKDPENAWKHYMKFTSLGGSKTFTELIKEAGLKSPFDEECLKEVCETAERWLSK
ncbi:MAG: M3 family oligoendopeptidase [Oscillospiraceae bacterium]|nr:M3 family oligoendopeptidase [Oscillospiraceae bacterium]